MSVDFSIVMPTFRRPHTILHALKSVLEQEALDLEVLVIDDCPDGSAEKIVRGLKDERIQYLRNPQPSNGRPAQVRNFGLSFARGDLIHFLDDDDIVPPGHYAAVKNAFAHHPEVGVVFGRMEGFGENAGQVRSESALFIDGARRAALSEKLRSRRALTARLLFQPLLFVGGAAVVRRSCVEAVGGYDTSMEVMEDVDLYARIIRQYGAHYMDRIALRYRIGPSMMHRPDMQEIISRSYLTMQRKFRKTRGSVEFYALKIAARSVLRAI